MNVETHVKLFNPGSQAWCVYADWFQLSAIEIYFHHVNYWPALGFSIVRRSLALAYWGSYDIANVWKSFVTVTSHDCSSFDFVVLLIIIINYYYYRLFLNCHYLFKMSTCLITLSTCRPKKAMGRLHLVTLMGNLYIPLFIL